MRAFLRSHIMVDRRLEDFYEHLLQDALTEHFSVFKRFCYHGLLELRWRHSRRLSVMR